MRHRSLTFASIVLVAPALVHANPDDDWGSRHHGGWRQKPQGYVALKGGSMALGDNPTPDGVYVGLDAGSTLSRVLDIGFSLDYFHRRSRDLDVLFETNHGFEPPVQGVSTRFESAADFVPIGLSARLRLPVRTGALAPFVAGSVSYEVLHLSFFDRDAPRQPYDNVLGTDETFMGVGWQASAGLEVGLAEGVGLFGELGMHRGTPSRSIELDGQPVDLRVRMNGGFLRAGLRLAL
jgi:hypothetical protein